MAAARVGFGIEASRIIKSLPKSSVRGQQPLPPRCTSRRCGPREERLGSAADRRTNRRTASIPNCSSCRNGRNQVREPIFGDPLATPHADPFEPKSVRLQAPDPPVTSDRLKAFRRPPAETRRDGSIDRGVRVRGIEESAPSSPWLRCHRPGANLASYWREEGSCGPKLRSSRQRPQVERR